MEQRILGFLNNNFPISFTKVEPVTNEMYRCFGDQGNYFARITNYRTYEEQLEEVNWTNFLYKNGMDVSPTISSIDGHSVEKMTPEDKLVVLYRAAPGRHLSNAEWDALILKKLGRQIGKMHRLTKEYEKIRPFTHVSDWYKQEEYRFDKYIPQQESTIKEFAQEVISKIKEIPADKSAYGVIHGDVWLENTVVDKHHTITFIDFQDCEKHFLIYDLVVPLYSALRYTFIGKGNIRDYKKAILEALVEGYMEEYHISNEMLEKLPLFLLLKEVFEYNLMHMYWNQDKLSEDQVRLMNFYRMNLEYNHSII
ncbi:phosphotransferase [Bacillus sp. FSL W7-1360]